MKAKVSYRYICIHYFMNNSHIKESCVIMNDCIQFSLMNLPCLFFVPFLFLLGRITTFIRPSKPIQGLIKYRFEIFFVILSILCHISFLIIYSTCETEDNTVDFICYSTEIFLILTLISNSLFVYFNRITHNSRSYLEFIFWIIYFFSFIPRFYSMIDRFLNHFPQFPVSHYEHEVIVLCILRVTFSSILLILKSFTNKVYPKLAIYPIPVLKSSREINPEPYAGILSAWTFHWLNPTVWKAFRGRIKQMDDFFFVRPHESVNKNYNKLTKYWKQLLPLQNYRPLIRPREPDQEHVQLLRFSESHLGSNNNLALIKAILASFGRDLYFAWILSLLSGLLLFTFPIFLTKIIQFLYDDSSQQLKCHGYGYIICFGLLMASISMTMLYQFSLYYCYHIGNRIKVSMTSLLYRKALSISSISSDCYSTGNVVVLATTDIEKLMCAVGHVHNLFLVIMQVSIATFLLWSLLGLSAFVGLIPIFAFIPLNIIGGRIVHKFKCKELNEKNKRMRLLREILNDIKIFKLYAWELAFEKILQEQRIKELKMLAGSFFASAISNITWMINPFLTIMSTFLSFLALMLTSNHTKVNILTSEKVFVAFVLFSQIPSSLHIFSNTLNILLMSLKSVERLTGFLFADEIDYNGVKLVNGSDFAIQFKNASFKWNSSQQDIILNNLNFSIRNGNLVALVGPMCYEKSPLLSAILCEMIKVDGEIVISGSLGYISKFPWLQKHTIVGNILFGSNWDRKFYLKVTKACALRSEISMMNRLDETVIGERELNLSEGQEQLINIARAVYQRRDIYLMDDPLYVLDTHLSKQVFRQVLGPEGILNQTTRLIVTNSIHFLPYYDQIIVINSNGFLEQEVSFKLNDIMYSIEGTYDELMGASNSYFRDYIKLSESNYISSRNSSISVETYRNDYLNQNYDSPRNTSPDNVSDTSSVSQWNLQSTKFEAINEEDDQDYYDENIDAQIQVRIPSVQFNFQPDLDPDSDNNFSDDEWAETIKFPSLKVIGESLSEEKFKNENISWKTYYSYFIARSLFLMAFFLLIYTAFGSLESFASFWLKSLVDDTMIINVSNKLKDPKLNSTQIEFLANTLYNLNHEYLKTYCYICLGLTLLALLFNGFTYGSTLLASKTLHHKLLYRVLRAPCSFFDKVTIGRILNQFSADLDVIDHKLPYVFQEACKTFINMIVITVVIFLSLKPFYFGILIFIPISACFVLIHKIYLSCSRQARQLNLCAESSILNFLVETVMNRDGLSTIRVFNKIPIFTHTMNELINQKAAAYFLKYSFERWLDIRLYGLGNLFIFLISIFIVYNRDNYTPGMAGLMMVFILQFTENLSRLTKNISKLENSALHLESFEDYSEIAQEDFNIRIHRPHTSWPEPFSKVIFENVTVVYPDCEKPAIENISFTFGGSHSERFIGIVGPKGAGKSTLVKSLFRIVELNKGSISIDNLDITQIGLHDLRNAIKILPKNPAFFSGSLRKNLDPFDRFSDDAIWKVLQQVHLEAWVSGLWGGLQFGFDQKRCNISKDQRLLLSLARILLTEDEVRFLVLDEFTPLLDPYTNPLIMKIILDSSENSKFRQTSILIITDRLSTIMDADLVLVMHNGTFVEKGHPQELLNNQNSMLYKMHAEPHYLI